MEPYVIICNSCTARLKVTNEALIGQRLACPKCQSMIDVVPPDGYERKPSEDSRCESALSGNFEDIESLLAKTQHEDVGQVKYQPRLPSKKSNHAPKSKGKSKLDPIPPVRTQPPPATTITQPAASSGKGRGKGRAQEPILPGADWDSEAARQKKRILQIVMLALLAIGASGTGIWALFGKGDSSARIAQNEAPIDESTSVAEAADRKATEANKSPDAAMPIESQPTTAIASPAELPPPDIDDNSARQSSPPPLSVVPIPKASQTSEEAPTTTTAQNPADQGEQADHADQSEQAEEMTSPLFPVTEDETSSAEDTPASPRIASTENSLGKLSAILKGQGTSLKQIEDIAEIQKERALIGTPAYLIEVPDRKEMPIQRQLSGELSGWKLDDVPLIDAIGDLEMLSGLPVTFDPDLFDGDSLNITRPVSMKVEDVTFQTAFEMLLADDGLVVHPTATGLLVTAPTSNDVTPQTYPQSFCTDLNATDRLKKLIIAVTGINDWDNDENYQLSISIDSVAVSHRQAEQKRIADLLQKLNAAADYQSDPATMKQTLLPLAMKAENALAAAPNLAATNPYRHSMRIGSLFRTVRQSTKLVTIVDWENLATRGWYPNTRMPGRIDEPTNRKLLNQLGHAMEATTIVVGRDTVMLTTFENAGKQTDIEVYSVGDVIDNKMTPAQLDQLMTETLGVDQLTPPNAIVIYFAECKCLVANAPQIIQRQISSIVDEL